MTQEEILEYNKRCALFLGAIDSTHEWGFMLQPNELNLSFDLFDEKLFSNDGGSGWFVKDLKFHSDWNWIMEVVEAIERLVLGDIKIPVTFSSMHEGVRHKIEEYYNASAVFRIENSNCRVDIVGTMRLRNDFIVIDDLPTKKEAVVQAINQFLIWYNEQRT